MILFLRCHTMLFTLKNKTQSYPTLILPLSTSALIFIVRSLSSSFSYIMPRDDLRSSLQTNKTNYYPFVIWATLVWFKMYENINRHVLIDLSVQSNNFIRENCHNISKLSMKLHNIDTHTHKKNQNVHNKF